MKQSQGNNTQRNSFNSSLKITVLDKRIPEYTQHCKYFHVIFHLYATITWEEDQ
jgi:hypothetical protein